MSKILIIEDEAAIRRVLKKIITEESDKYQVEEAEDGLSGIEMIRNSDYDLVLCDIKMPKMDGIEYDDKTKSFPIKVSVSDVADELQKAYGSQALKKDERSGEFPTQKWIKGAFNKLVSYKLASQGSKEGEYLIHFKSLRDDVLDRFIRLGLEKDKKKTLTILFMFRLSSPESP